VRLVDTEERIFLFSISGDIGLVRHDFPPRFWPGDKVWLLGTRPTGTNTSCRELHFYLIVSAFHAKYLPLCRICIDTSFYFYNNVSFSIVSLFYFFFRHTFLIYVVSFFFLSFVAFISIHSNVRVHLSPIFLLPMHINSHCPRRPIQEGEVCLWQNSHLGVYASSFFFSLFPPLLE
jgi:hypothetical protein